VEFRQDPRLMLLNIHLLLPVLWCGSTVSAATALLRWDDPDPFRRERLEERPYTLRASGLLDRFSFEPQPALSPGRRLSGNGIEGTAGSTSSNELYVRSRAQWRAELGDAALAGVALRRDEDLDGRYDAALVGLGLRRERWEAMVHGDVVATKEDIDVQVETTFRAEQYHLRLLSVLVDPVYNDKQNDGRYTRYPLTLFTNSWWQLNESTRLYGFAQINLPMQLELATTGQRATDRETASGLGIAMQPLATWVWSLELEGLHGDRAQRFDADLLTGPAREAWELDQSDPLPVPRFDPGPWPLREVRRRYVATTTEVRQTFPDQMAGWLGLRALYLREIDTRDSAAESLHLRRREYLLYGGWRWPVAQQRAYVSPTLFVNRFSGEGSPDQADERAWQVKLAPAFDVVLDQQRQALLTLNLTMRLDEPGFGGGNAQVFIPF